MKDFHGRMIPIGDPLPKAIRDFVRYCKMCGGKCESRRRRYKRVTCIKHVCTCCGYTCSSKKRR